MSISYKVLPHEEDYHAIYNKLRTDDLFWALWPDVDKDDWTQDAFVSLLSRPDMLVLGALIDGAIAGVMFLHPVMPRSMAAEIGVTAFRPFFPQAAALCRGALLWACERLDPASFLGKVAAPNRHALFMLERVGFSELGRVPGLCWYTRKQTFVDGVLVIATPDSIKKAGGI